MDIYRSVICI